MSRIHHLPVVAALGLLAPFVLMACQGQERPLAVAPAPAGQTSLDALSARVADLEGRLAKLETAREAIPNKFTLTETWLVPDQPATTSQTPFTSMAACEAARQKAVAAADSLAQQAGKMTVSRTPDGGALFTPPTKPTTLNAVCSG